MLVFSETNKRIFNYISKKLYIGLVNLQTTICQLSPVFTANFSFSIFLLSFPTQKYISCLGKCFLALARTTALAIEVSTLMYLWSVSLTNCTFFPRAGLYSCPEFPNVSSVLALAYYPGFCSLEVGQAAADNSPLRNRKLGSVAMPSNQ